MQCAKLDSIIKLKAEPVIIHAAAAELTLRILWNTWRGKESSKIQDSTPNNENKSLNLMNANTLNPSSTGALKIITDEPATEDSIISKPFEVKETGVYTAGPSKVDSYDSHILLSNSRPP